MNAKLLCSAIVFASAIGLSVPAFSMDHMINGKAVPANQTDAVQAKCDELRAATPDAGATTTTPDTGAAATTPDANAAATTPGAAASMNSDQIDLGTLTVQMCDEGGFSATAK
ncbi:MAG TPA: hypothetical protein VL147_21015 [Devosia sp.]|nr:hypothetical protein [Devosia sp.]